MKYVTTILSVVLLSSTVFADTQTKNCKSEVLAKAAIIKSEAKAQIRNTEDMIDVELDNSGEITVGNATRGMDQDAEAILTAVRELQQDSSMSLDPALERLCKNKFDFEKTISE